MFFSKLNKSEIKDLEVLILMSVRLFTTPWTVAYQTSPSMGFSRQEYWSGLPFPIPGDFPNPGIELISPALAGRFFTTSNTWEGHFMYSSVYMLEKAMAPHSSTLAWKIPWMEKSGGLQSMGLAWISHLQLISVWSSYNSNAN